MAQFKRTSSQICPTPEEELLEAVFNNNTDKIEQLLIRYEHLKSHTFSPYNKRILLIACSEDGIQAKTVEKLLSMRANPRDHTEEEGWEALHWASQKTDLDILNILLRRNPGDVNVIDKFGNNALHILIRHGQRDSPDFFKCAELLISKGINLDHVNDKNKTALYWAEKKGISDEIQNIISKKTPPGREIMNNNLQNNKELTPFDYLKHGDEIGFINFIETSNNTADIVNYSENGPTLLQKCCMTGLTEAVKLLLEKGADYNLIGCKDSNKPVIIAAQNGNSEILRVLLEKYSRIVDIPEGVLATILQYIDNEYSGNMDCYRVFIDKIKGSHPDEISLKLNEKDKNNNTPLHYAVRYGDQEIVQELLSLGASLGATNRYGVMPIQDIEPEELEKHLNNCVMFDLKSKKIDKEDFQVKFQYRSLIPPYARSSRSERFADKDIEAKGINSTIQKELVSETEVIFFMSKTPEFKHLLKHPVIVSFLFMKWLRIQWLFWANLAFYVAFALSLVVYIFSDYAFFTIYEKSTTHNFFANLSYICLIITLLILIFREIFQICVTPTKYFQNFENYIEIILIVITAMIVTIKSPSFDTRKQLSSIAILLAAFELVLMLGQHPYFSTNVVMLRTVSFNFFKFLIWYSLLIIAFALSFYLLFAPDTNANDTRVEMKNTTSEEDDKSFISPGRSVFKTIIMLTGEFDASDLNFDTFPITSKIIFALFIFMIAIILLNLLNGLAVSDTQMIKNDAELVGHIARAQHIKYVESMLIGNIIPANALKKINDICCCCPFLYRGNFKIGSAFDVWLFPKYMKYELVFYPNKYGKVDSSENEQKCLKRSCAPCAQICLDRDTIRRTNEVVKERRDQDDKSTDNQIKQLQSDVLILQKKIDEMLLILKP